MRTSMMITVAAALSLAGCSTAYLAQRQCAGLGLSQGDAEYSSCINRESAIVENNRNRGATMMIQGGRMLQPPPNVYVIPRY